MGSGFTVAISWVCNPVSERIFFKLSLSTGFTEVNRCWLRRDEIKVEWKPGQSSCNRQNTEVTLGTSSCFSRVRPVSFSDGRSSRTTFCVRSSLQFFSFDGSKRNRTQSEWIFQIIHPDGRVQTAGCVHCHTMFPSFDNLLFHRKVLKNNPGHIAQFETGFPHRWWNQILRDDSQAIHHLPQVNVKGNSSEWRVDDLSF